MDHQGGNAMPKFKWGIVGTGWIAGEMAQTLSEEQGSIYSVASNDPVGLATFEKSYPIERLYGSVEELLDDGDVDIVYVATPHHIHSQIIRQSLEAGKHVVSEKAITINDTELEALIQLAQSKELILMEAMTVLHMPLWKKLKQEVDGGLVGNVKMIQINFGSHKEYDVKNRFFSPDLAGGALLDIGGYALNVARLFLSSQPDQLWTTVNYFETGVDEESVIVLKNAEGQMVSITLTMQAKQPKRALISGDKGYLEVYDYPRGDQAVFVETATGNRITIEAGDTSKALAYEVADMENYIKNNDLKGAVNITLDVLRLMTEVREQWGFKYPFETNINC